MTHEAAHQAALDLIAVHGRDAADVARDCVRVLLKCAEPDAVHSWIKIVHAIQAKLG